MFISNSLLLNRQRLDNRLTIIYNQLMASVFLYSLSQLKKIRDNFVEELTDASNGKKTSLAFVKNPLPIKAVATNNEIFQVMIIGGTVFKKALVKKINHQNVILEQNETPLPTFKTKEMVLSTVSWSRQPKNAGSRV